MQVLIFGATGQVARALAKCCPEGVTARYLARDTADLADPAACAAHVRDTAPDLVINAAAYTAVDRAEQEEALAHRINGDSPGAMAEAAARHDIPFLHVSSDYVFDGSGTTPWRPEDATAPLGAYGRSKLAGEERIRAAGGRHAILRTSWVFSATGANFVKTMRRLGAERDRLTVVADQVGGPTPADAIADALWRMAEAFREGRDRSGIYHFSGAPDVSWADFARAIFAQTGQTVEVVDIPTREFPTPAARPANSRMNCDDLRAVFGIERPDWRAGLARVLADLDARG
jgi:dTDP-4-dehydrorhamnose reductase